MTLAQHLNPLHVRRASITSALTAPECVEHLRADLARWYVFWGVSQCMKGRVGESGFALHRFGAMRKSLPTQARGRFEPDGRGTRIELEIGWRRVDLIGLSLVSLATIAVGAAVSHEDPRDAWVWVLFFPLMLLVSGIHRLATFHDDDWLVARLCELLGGSEVPVALD